MRGLQNLGFKRLRIESVELSAWARLSPHCRGDYRCSLGQRFVMLPAVSCCVSVPGNV